jgi:thiol:disulfide interchange protein DsbD
VPVDWRADALEARLPAGNVVNVTVRASVAPGWRIYAPGELAGPEPLIVTVAGSPVFAMKGAVRASAPTVRFDPNIGKDVAVYEDHAVLNLSVAVASAARPGRYGLGLEVRFQACNATVCLPPKTEVLEVPITVR